MKETPFRQYHEYRYVYVQLCIHSEIILLLKNYLINWRTNYTLHKLPTPMQSWSRSREERTRPWLPASPWSSCWQHELPPPSSPGMWPSSRRYPAPWGSTTVPPAPGRTRCPQQLRGPWSTIQSSTKKYSNLCHLLWLLKSVTSQRNKPDDLMKSVHVSSRFRLKSCYLFLLYMMMYMRWSDLVSWVKCNLLSYHI